MKRHAILTFTLCLALAINFIVPLQASAQPAATQKSPGFVPTGQYVTRNLCGWTVMVNRHLLTDQSALGGTVLALLQTKLQEITRLVPRRACSKLQRVPIWVGVNDGHAPCSEYHPSREWLREHGYNPDKAKSVEIGNADLFVKWSAEQPMLLLHEMAHAYQDQILGWESPTVKAVFDHAVRKGLYQSVPYYDGTRRRAYALSNEREYFAEGSEAYFGRNDFYPFINSELGQYDPELYTFLKQVWEL